MTKLTHGGGVNFARSPCAVAARPAPDRLLKMQNLQINPQRLWDTLMETAKFGATPKGGICRLTLTRLRSPGARLVQGPVRGARLHGYS